MIENIRWLGHGSFAIYGPPLVYINPWRIVREENNPDIILIGHDHYAHCSPADINKVRGPNTRIIGNRYVAEQVEGCSVLRPWQSMTVDRACIKAVPAYSPDDPRHPVEAEGLGFVISLNLFDIYYAGDTEIIPEMDLIHPDIAILPIDGKGTLTIEEAVAIVQKMKPRWVLPSNWGTSAEGATSLDALAFRDAVGNLATVVIPELSR